MSAPAANALSPDPVSTAQQVLFDAPGPKAQARNRRLSIASIAVFVLAMVGVL